LLSVCESTENAAEPRKNTNFRKIDGSWAEFSENNLFGVLQCFLRDCKYSEKRKYFESLSNRDPETEGKCRPRDGTAVPRKFCNDPDGQTHIATTLVVKHTSGTSGGACTAVRSPDGARLLRRGAPRRCTPKADEDAVHSPTDDTRHKYIQTTMDVMASV